MLIHFIVSSGWLKFSSTWFIIGSLKSINRTLSLLSVGYINTFKLSSVPLKLLLWCWIYWWLLPLFFLFCPFVWLWLSTFPWLISFPPWFAFTLSFSPGVEVCIFVCVYLFASMGFIYPTYLSLVKKIPNTFWKPFKMRLIASLFLPPWSWGICTDTCVLIFFLDESIHTQSCDPSIYWLLFTQQIRFFIGRSAVVRRIWPFQDVFNVAVYWTRLLTWFIFFFVLCWN